MTQAVEPNTETSAKPITGRDLLEALRQVGLVGMWKERTDIVDSVDYARFLRMRAQEREHDITPS